MKYIKALILLLKNPKKILGSALTICEEEIFYSKIKKKYKIEQLPTIDILDLVPNLNENLRVYSFLEGTSFVMDIILLKSLCKKFENCSYLEIGSWRGESIANVADVAKEAVSITLSAEELRQMNLSEDFIKVHGFFSKDIDNIKTVFHNSHTYDFTELNKKFDVIFVDGDHSYDGVLNDTKKVFELRKNSDSIIVWHDYGYSTEKMRPAVFGAILEGIPAEKHGNLYHVSNTLCAIYLENNNFDVTITKFPTYPNKNFSVQVKAEKI